MIDLHSHTLHSDGERSATELLAEAAAAGIEVLSVTDHDTVSGLAECAEAAGRVGVRLIPGIELSCELHGREIHILGHLFDPAARVLRTLADGMLAERRERMVKMVERAVALRLSGVTFERVESYSGGENFGRPHLARALVAAGHATSVKDAFDRWLSASCPLWVDRRRLPAREAIQLIHAAGGTASVAHPGANDVSKQELKGLAEMGLDAVEALHPEHVPTRAEAYQRWGEPLGLLVTAGSDYHGPRVQPGRKLGDRSLAKDRLAALEERARSYGR